jgi:hypothetical protein
MRPFTETPGNEISLDHSPIVTVIEVLLIVMVTVPSDTFLVIRTIIYPCFPCAHVPVDYVYEQNPLYP